VELHEECLPVLLELRSAVLQGPRFCPHFVRWEADHQSSGNPALAILINVVRPGCYRSVLLETRRADARVIAGGEAFGDAERSAVRIVLEALRLRHWSRHR